MEHNDKVKLAMVVGLYIAITLLIIAIIVLVKNVNEIKKDPIVYGIEKKNLVSCSCIDSKFNRYEYYSDDESANRNRILDFEIRDAIKNDG